MKSKWIGFLVIFLILVCYSLTWADSKITALTEDASPDSADLGYSIDDPSGTPASKKATWGNIITKAHGLGNWKLGYTNGSGVLTALELGADGTLLMGNGASAAPSFLAAGTSGYVFVAAGAADPVWTQYLAVTSGGSGAGSFTDGGILLGSGTGAFTALGAASNGQIPIGDGTTDPVLANITETGDVSTITNGAGTIDFSFHASLESIADLTETNGGIPYGTADNAWAWLAAGAEGTLLMGNGAGAPSFLAAGTAGYHLIANGAADPVWTAPTGTGSPVNATSPSLVTPDLGTPSALTLTNATGLPNAGLIVTAGDSYTNFSTSADDDTVDELMAALDTAIGNISITGQRFTQGKTAVAFTGADATPDVTNGGTSVVQFWQTADTTTITDLDDGDDHSEFANGDSLVIQCLHAQVFDLSDNANLKGHGNNDYTCAAGEFIVAIFDDTNDYWVLKPSETKTVNFTTLAIPNAAAADATLTAIGQVFLDDTDSAIAAHFGANGEVAGEAQISAIQRFSITFDPKVVCDGTIDRLFLFSVGDEAPNGITIDEWTLSFEADPTTEFGANHVMLKRADAMIGVANAANMDALDTTNGYASEDTDANINADAVVANGQEIYLQFDTAYTEVGHQVMFQLWYHAEED